MMSVSRATKRPPQPRGESIGLASVYRSLAGLVESEDVEVLTRLNGEEVYVRCSPYHHHHLVCRSCDQAIEINGPGLERWADELAECYGYTAVCHTLEVFGLCPGCSSIDPPTDAAPAGSSSRAGS